MSGATPLRLQLSPSPGFATAILAAHAAASGCLWLLFSGDLGVVLAGLVFALGAAAAWDKALLAAPASPRAIELSAADAMVLVLRDGRRVPAAVGGGRWVSRLCVVLPVRAPLRRTLLLSAGMLDAEPFRALRVWALWGRTPGHPGVTSGQRSGQLQG